MLYGKKLLHTWIKEIKSKIMYFFADEEILQSIKSFYKEKKLSDFFFSEVCGGFAFRVFG